MKRFLLSTLILLSAQFVYKTASAQNGEIDVLIANGNVSLNTWTYQVYMKAGSSYSPNWTTMQIIVDVDFPTALGAPTITSVSQVLTSEASSNYEAISAFGTPLPNHEAAMRYGFSNPSGPVGDVTSTYKHYSTVTVTFSSPIPPLTQFTIRDFANASGYLPFQRSNWSDVLGQRFEVAGQNADQSPLLATPLTVSLLSFNATATPERTAKLEWETATEKNSSHFIVERSADGMRFTEQVCRMQAVGTSNVLQTYHNFDYKPLNGNNYYRLKMVDKDGSFKYSETRRLFFEAPVADVVAFPNPFQSATSIRVSADQDQMANYNVMDYTGRVVRSGVWEVKKGVQEFPMPLEDAASGNYILTVQGSTILAELKLTKSN